MATPLASLTGLQDRYDSTPSFPVPLPFLYSSSALSLSPRPLSLSFYHFFFLLTSVIIQILNTLRELNLAENTLVVFTSDNGPWLIQNENGGSAGLFYGGKGSTWEGGIRMVCWWMEWARREVERGRGRERNDNKYFKIASNSMVAWNDPCVHLLQCTREHYGPLHHHVCQLSSSLFSLLFFVYFFIPPSLPPLPFY